MALCSGDSRQAEQIREDILAENQRLCREGIPEEYARARVAAQQSDAFYRDACGYTLVNDCATAEEFGRNARVLLERILQEHKGR